jgi:hypothetical protein
VLDRHGQTYSLSLDDEHYADLPVSDLDVFPTVAKAVAAGDVVARHHYLQATDLPVAIEMRVGPSKAPLFSRTRTFSNVKLSAGDAAFYDRRYLPYRR